MTTFVEIDDRTVSEVCAIDCAPGAPADCEDETCGCPHHNDGEEQR